MKIKVPEFDGGSPWQTIFKRKTNKKRNTRSFEGSGGPKSENQQKTIGKTMKIKEPEFDEGSSRRTNQEETSEDANASRGMKLQLYKKTRLLRPRVPRKPSRTML